MIPLNELKHFLGTGLICELYDEPAEMIGLEKGDDDKWYALFNEFDTISLDEIKPLLIPLSELTETNWIELAKIDGFFIEGEHIDLFQDGMGIKQGYHSFSLNADGFHLSISRNPARVNNQICLFEYLFKNHYDVFDWIGRKLAINKLTNKV